MFLFFSVLNFYVLFFSVLNFLCFYSFQCKNVDNLSKELDLPTSQLLGLFNTLLRKMTSALRNLQEKSIEKSLNVGGQKNKFASNGVAMKPLNEELQEAAEELMKKQKEDLKQLKHLDLSSYQVKVITVEFLTNIKYIQRNFLCVVHKIICQTFFELTNINYLEKTDNLKFCFQIVTKLLVWVRCFKSWFQLKFF